MTLFEDNKFLISIKSQVVEQLSRKAHEFLFVDCTLHAYYAVTE